MGNSNTEANQKRAVIETLMAVTIWSMSFIMVKIVLQQISPFTLIVFRFAIGAGLLFVFAAVRGELRQFKRADLGVMALLGIFGITLQQALQVSGQATADAGVAAFLANTSPAFILLFAALFLHERIWKWQVVGFIVATVGAMIVSTAEGTAGLKGSSMISPANLLVLVSSVVWAAFSVLSRSSMASRPPILITAGMMGFGCLFSLPVFIYQQGWKEMGSITPVGWGALAYIAILSTAIAYLLYLHGLSLAPASHTTALQNIEPLGATAAGIIFLHEPLSLNLAIGGAAILIGTSLVQRAIRRPADQE